jgi:protein SCO1/2
MVYRPAFFRTLICLLAFATLGLVGCTPRQENERVFTVQGVVRGPYDPGQKSISIQHEEIPGFMPAMIMPFLVDETDVADLRPGDRVVFEFRVGEESRATAFRKVGVETSMPETPSSPRVSRRLKEGEVVPPVQLVDQDGAPFAADAFEGRLTVLSFMFTRCPVPEFCPLLATKYQNLQRALGASPDGTPAVQLLCVTLDPDHDQPAILRAYGDSLGADFSRWQFLTGERAEIENLTRLFAVRAETNGASIDHTLATALIGPRGELLEVWRGNAWKPEEVLTRVRKEQGVAAR